MIKVMILRWRDDCGLSGGPTPSKGSYETESGGQSSKGRECDCGTREEGLRQREREGEREITEVDAITNKLALKMEGARSQEVGSLYELKKTKKWISL